ncbi:MAG TPA: CheR family methyltransferase [Candidatus Acidoferrum sp.]|nr:CheR family methyltransferase [Candidatus Acidoferrum sp.]
MTAGSARAATDTAWLRARLGSRDYARLGAYIEATTGIRMPPNRLPMLEGRLRSRLRELGLDSFSTYCEQALGRGGDPAELSHLIDLATTNTTEFFREAAHFEVLARQVLPELRAEGSRDEIFIWSAGCSTGEEAYTLAMVLSEEASRNQGPRHRILATDISRDVLRVAARAIYPESQLRGISGPLRERYLLRNRNRETASVRIVPSLRQQVTFRHLNLMDAEFAVERPVDVLFCRNVFIYFDRETQHRILLQFFRHMNPGGYLFLGHTDTIYGLDIPLVRVAPSVYRRPPAGRREMR